MLTFIIYDIAHMILTPMLGSTIFLHVKLGEWGYEKGSPIPGALSMNIYMY